MAAIEVTSGVERAIFTSSQLVCRVGYVPRSDTDYAPSTLYGESKVWTERIVRETDGGGAAWCLVRPTTIWGPGMSAHYQRFLRMIAKGRYVHVGTSLSKSYGYVGNVVHQIERLLAAPAGEIRGKTLYLADEAAPLAARLGGRAPARDGRAADPDDSDQARVARRPRGRRRQRSRIPELSLQLVPPRQPPDGVPVRPVRDRADLRALAGRHARGCPGARALVSRHGFGRGGLMARLLFANQYFPPG